MALKTLVYSESGSRTPTVAISTQFAEPAFQLLTNIKLDTEMCDLEERTTHHLAHCVARNPGYLMAHVQRIVLHVKRKESDAVQGALLDLFIVLGTKGMQLRERMVKLAKPLLSSEALAFFIANTSQGVSAADVLPASTCSVLTKSLSGTTELVKQIEDVQIQDRDPLQDARDCLEFGQVAQAQTILEEAILDQPDRAELHHDLLEIYRYTADKESFETMHSRLGSKNHPLSQDWENMAAAFEDAVNR